MTVTVTRAPKTSCALTVSRTAETFRSYSSMRLHFHHQQGEAPDGLGRHWETAEHLRGKQLITDWAKNQHHVLPWFVEEEFWVDRHPAAERREGYPRRWAAARIRGPAQANGMERLGSSPRRVRARRRPRRVVLVAGRSLPGPRPATDERHLGHGRGANGDPRCKLLQRIPSPHSRETLARPLRTTRPPHWPSGSSRLRASLCLHQIYPSTSAISPSRPGENSSELIGRKRHRRPQPLRDELR